MYAINVWNIERKDRFKDALKAYTIWCLVIPSPNGSKSTKSCFYYFGKLLAPLFKWFKHVALHDIQLLYDYKLFVTLAFAYIPPNTFHKIKVCLF